MHFTLADLVTDITQNACESGANLVELEIREGGKKFCFVVRDNGKGMSADDLKQAVDPFVTDGVKHPHRKVGLGLPFLIQTAEQSGGGWRLVSAKAGQTPFELSGGVSHSETPMQSALADCTDCKGTIAAAWFDTTNVDTPPMGDLPGMFRTILMFAGPADIHITRSLAKADGAVLEYAVRKSELADALGDLADTGSLVLLGQYLRSLEEDN